MKAEGIRTLRSIQLKVKKHPMGAFYINQRNVTTNLTEVYSAGSVGT